MDNIITMNNLHRANAYVENIVVADKTEEEHNKKNFQNFLRSPSYTILLSTKKSSLPTTSINFLNYTISHGILKTNGDQLCPLK